MKKITRLLAALMALLMLCVPALAETTEATTSPDDVLATVNGQNVTRAQFDGYYASLEGYYAQYYDVTDPEIVSLLKEFAMETAIQYAIMDQKIVELGLELTDAERADAEQLAREDWEAVVADGMAYYGITADSTEEERATMMIQILAELESMGYTEASYIADGVMYAGYDKLQAEMIKDAVVTDEEVKAYYDSLVEADQVAYQNDAASYESAEYMNQMYLMYGMADYYMDLYYKPEGYRAVTHILLEVEEDLLAAYTNLQAAYEEQQVAIEEGEEVTETLVTAEEVEAARLAVIASVQPTIDEINQKLAEGTAFADLIPLYSADPGMQDAESIAAGYEVHMDSVNWDTAFRDAAFTVDNVGDVTEPVVGSFGVHILQYAADVPGGPVEYTDELRETLRADLLLTAQNNAYSQKMTQWTEEATIVYSDEALAMLPATVTAE